MSHCSLKKRCVVKDGRVEEWNKRDACKTGSLDGKGSKEQSVMRLVGSSVSTLDGGLQRMPTLDQTRMMMKRIRGMISSSVEDMFQLHHSLTQKQTPPADYASMLVFNPADLPQILDAIITNYPICLKDPTPANTLYMLARFACLTCDHTWLEDLIMGAADTIEEAFFVSSIAWIGVS